MMVNYSKYYVLKATILSTECNLMSYYQGSMGRDGNNLIKRCDSNLSIASLINAAQFHVHVTTPSIQREQIERAAEIFRV